MARPRQTAEELPPHGTVQRWKHRTNPCDGSCGGQCRLAYNEWMRDYRKANGKNTYRKERVPAHGTIERYRSRTYECRCGECVLAWETDRKRRPTPDHGTLARVLSSRPEVRCREWECGCRAVYDEYLERRRAERKEIYLTKPQRAAMPKDQRMALRVTASTKYLTKAQRAALASSQARPATSTPQSEGVALSNRPGVPRKK